MKLWYHKGNNFGDALNPFIFEKLLPDFFDEDESTNFLGIGSILGFQQSDENRKIVFTSGFADGDLNTYGKAPNLEKNYQVYAVRGPKTAQLLGLPEKKAVTDGAILLHDIIDIEEFQTGKVVGYIPHVGSLNFNNWEAICKDAGLLYISPAQSVDQVLSQMKKCKLIIAEAMHGAIVADTLRIPWIAIKAYPTVNVFKWEDWCESMALCYNPVELPSIYSEKSIRIILKGKSKKLIPSFIVNPIARRVHKKQMKKHYGNLTKQLEVLAESKGLLSEEPIFRGKLNELRSILEQIKSDHKR